MSKQIFTVGELADYLKVSQKTIYRAVENGQVQHFKVRGAIRFDFELHVLPFLNSQNSATHNQAPAKLANVGPFQHIDAKA